MKTVLINCSPKKKFTASAYFISLQKLFVKGQKVGEVLRNKNDYDRILENIKDADTVVFCMPLYVDCVPSHVLPFLKVMEDYCKKNAIHLNVYAVTNNGYIEGVQSEPLLQVLENFCNRSGLHWRGGVGIGGGVMLNVTRIVFYVQIGVLFLNIFLNILNTGSWFHRGAFENFISQALLLGFFNLGVLYYLGKQGLAINKGENSGKKYTRILIPSFIFILFADVFYVIVSVLEGGMFRGLLKRK